MALDNKLELDLEYQIDLAAKWLQEANYTVALTGAGISVPSGIPDFRSPGGLWSHFDPWEVCSTWALEHNPQGVWEFLLEAIDLFQKAAPNPAHKALADLEKQGILKAIITQNIDGLHQRAGSKNVIEFHGGCTQFYCHKCHKSYPFEQVYTLNKDTIPWLCSDCGGTIRPDVVFFGEQIPSKAMLLSQAFCSEADLALVIGTSGEVAPANTLPAMVKQRGGRIIEINLGKTAYEGVSDLKIEKGAEQVLPLILTKLT
ncbi:MAG: NAD-dependent deacylase [Desulfonauticus sp.]|nr:NAD-dependent deacylase [Desulfonauticus sp.]